MRHVFDEAKWFILNTRCCHSVTRHMNFMYMYASGVHMKFVCRVSDGNECSK